MIMYSKKELARIIEGFRHKNGLTQTQFAERAGISTRSVSSIENPKKDKSLDIDIIEKALKAANCSLIISNNF